ncbi:MAG: hypothetical protein JW820_15780 [Spirochaetales bacterium]|nr:hypothetical protein [Spirochaetales bacterium]
MCERVDELIRGWERTGVLSPEELALVSEHLARCRRCAGAYGALLPLLRRDAGGTPGLGASPGPLTEGFADRLLGRLGGALPARAGGVARIPRWGVFPLGGSRVARLHLVLAASAALLVAAGLVAWFWGYRPRGEEVLVRFELVAPEARQVNLVGDFNGWDPEGLAMKDATGKGEWRITVRLKKGKVYTYNFLMDGQRWIADPGSWRQVDDGFGGTSSVLEL